METHPPKLIEQIVGKLIPPACQEHILGDMYERYESPRQYIADAAALLPFVIASQVCRAFRIELVLSEAAALCIAFAGASLGAGAGYLYDRSALVPPAIVIAIVLLVLRLCDAYEDPQDRRRRTSRLHVTLAFACAYTLEQALRLLNAQWRVPDWIMLAGSAAGIPMLIMLREFFRMPQRGAATAVASGSKEEIRRRLNEEHRKTWRVNSVWMAAALLLVITTPKVMPVSGWQVASGILFVGIFLLAAWRSKHGRMGSEREYTSLPLSGDPYRNDLERKIDGLQFWAAGGSFSLLPGAGSTLILEFCDLAHG